MSSAFHLARQDDALSSTEETILMSSTSDTTAIRFGSCACPELGFQTLGPFVCWVHGLRQRCLCTQGGLDLKPTTPTALSVSSAFVNYAPCLVSQDAVGAAATAVGLNIVPQVRSVPSHLNLLLLLLRCPCALSGLFERRSTHLCDRGNAQHSNRPASGPIHC